jgi:hypothetical protein
MAAVSQEDRDFVGPSFNGLAIEGRGKDAELGDSVGGKNKCA